MYILADTPHLQPHTYLYICISACICMYVRMFMRMFVCVFVYIYMYMHLCMYVYRWQTLHSYIYTHVYVCMCVWVLGLGIHICIRRAMKSLAPLLDTKKSSSMHEESLTPELLVCISLSYTSMCIVLLVRISRPVWIISLPRRIYSWMFRV